MQGSILCVFDLWDVVRGIQLSYQIQYVIEIVMMAFALGMDAFSLSVGIGLSGIRKNRAIELSVMIGVFHILMTLIGLSFGLLLGSFLGSIAKWFGAALLIGLGLHMIYSTMSDESEKVRPIVSPIGMVMFAAGVSLDALSVGFSLGLHSTTYGLVSALTFGLVGTFLCMVGIWIGKHFSHLIGKFGELFGAILLIACGLRFLLK